MSSRRWNRPLVLSLLIHIGVLAAVGAAYYRMQASPRTLLIPVKLAVSGGNGDNPSIENPGKGPGKETQEASSFMEGTREEPHDETDEERRSYDVAVPSAADSGITGKESSMTGRVSGDGSLASGGSGKEAAGEGGSGSGSGHGSGDGNGSGTGTDLSHAAVLSSYRKIYPPEARKAGEEGSVVVGVSVDASGQVTEAWIISSSGYDRLDRAAVESAYSWRFEPATDAAGAVVGGQASVRVRYELN
jgi:protein TonB